MIYPDVARQLMLNLWWGYMLHGYFIFSEASSLKMNNVLCACSWFSPLCIANITNFKTAS